MLTPVSLDCLYRFAPTLATILFCTNIITAQRLQPQAHAGVNFSEAFLHDNVLTQKETSIFYDSIGNVQLGLGLNIGVFNHFHLRVEGNYKNFRTFFQTEAPTPGGPVSVLGNLYKENWTISLLPEFRINLLKATTFELLLYACAGPVLSLEQGKNFSYALVIYNGAYEVIDRIKPNATTGWSIGAGANPKWRRLGALAELRYTRVSAASEGGAVPEVSFGHLAFIAGMTVDLWQ